MPMKCYLLNQNHLLSRSVNNCRGSRVAGRKSRVAGRKSRVAGKKSRVNFNYLIIIFNRNKSSKKPVAQTVFIVNHIMFFNYIMP